LLAGRLLRDLAGRILRKSGLHAQLLRDLGDLFGRVVGSEDRRLRRQIMSWEPSGASSTAMRSSPVSGCGPLKTALSSRWSVGENLVSDEEEVESEFFDLPPAFD